MDLALALLGAFADACNALGFLATFAREARRPARKRGAHFGAHFPDAPSDAAANLRGEKKNR